MKLPGIILIYEKIKKLALKSFLKNEFNIALKHIETAANIAYMFNWIYSDSELEILLQKISDSIITKENKFIPLKNRIVFYDVFGLDNRGLTQQYVRAIISLDYDLLYILDAIDIKNSTKILNEIQTYPKAKIFIIDSKNAYEQKIQQAYQQIVDFQPQKAFLHLHPSSVGAIVLWNAFPEVCRYQINLTDHGFWLGSKAINYCLEFRNYGFTVSNEKRFLNKNQLLVQPFYPIIDTESFCGFPESIQDDTIKIFTGGSYYKMFGKDNQFLKIINDLLNFDKRVIILIAGGGDKYPLSSFIERNNLENRIFLLGHRKDINFVFQNCDIYLSTFPLAGGLMTQYAAVNSKPILSYSTSNLACNFLDDLLFFNFKPNFKTTHTNMNTFLHEAEKLIKLEHYRNEIGALYKKSTIKINNFENNLKCIIENNLSNFSGSRIEIDYNEFTKLYVENDFKHLKQFEILIISIFKTKALFLFPALTLSFIFSKKSFNLLFKKMFIK